MNRKLNVFMRALGPGIVYAAAAVGISHLVQSTRAGALYGLSMMLVILVIAFLKYPALRFGADYAAITGHHLLREYQYQGRWVNYLVALITAFTMIFVMASLGLVTAGLFKAITGVNIPDILIAGLLLVFCGMLLVFGHYRLLERVSKLLVPVFSTCILVAFFILALKLDIEWGMDQLLPPIQVETVLFIVLLAGFMPTPIDGSILQSLWTCAKARDLGSRPTPGAVRLDFNIGYILSLVLALCFLVMGASVFYNTGTVLAGNGGQFAAQVIDMFTSAIGEWAFAIIGIAAFTVMLSTMVTILDGYPRTLATIYWQLRGQADPPENDRVMTLVVMLNCAGSILVMLLLMRSFQMFIDLTSTLVFLTGPLYAWLNHRAMYSARIPRAQQPGTVLRFWSLAGIAVMTAVALAYVYLVLQ